MKTNEVFISVVFALHDADDDIEAYLSELADTLERHFAYFEIIVIDNGSDDDTPRRIEAMQARIKNVRLYCLPRQASKEVALVAGLDNAIGDFIATIEAPEDPPSVILDMMARIDENAEIVYALQRNRVAGKGMYNRLTRFFLALLGKVANLDMPTAVSTCRLFSRAVLNYMLEASDRHLTLPVAQALTGYRYQTITYRRNPPYDRGSRGSVGLASLGKAFNLLFSTSMRPLRIVSLLSLGVSVLSLVYAGYVLVVAFAMEGVAKGWPSMSLQISLFFFLLFLILAVMGEYMLSIAETVSRRPLYTISHETNSSVMDYVQDLNVDTVDDKPGENP